MASINGKTTSVIRWVWSITHPDKPLAADWIVWRYQCGNERCCNPMHLTAGTRKKWGEWVKRTKRWQARPSYRAANKANGLKRTVLTQAVVAEVRDGIVSAESLAQRLGVDVSSVHRALRRTDMVANASVFNFRPKSKKAA